MQSLISISDSERLGLYNLTDAAIKGGVFPKDWLSGSSVRTPYFGQNPPYLQNQANGRFDFSIYDIPKSACVKLVVRVSSIGAMAGHGEIGSFGRTSLGYVLIGDMDTGINSPYINVFPISIDNASSYCKTNNRISFGFGFTRINN